MQAVPSSSADAGQFLAAEKAVPDPPFVVAVKAVYASVAKGRATPNERDMGFFLRRRAEMLVAADPSYVANDQKPGYPKLVQRLETDCALVQQFVDVKLGSGNTPGQLTGGVDPHSPAHLDLADLAKVKTSTTPSKAALNLQAYKARRLRRVHNIIWRAAGIEAALWSGTSLNLVAFEQMLDRRLRIVERMNLQVSEAHALAGGGTAWTRSGARGPWEDGFRVRLFEYPRVSLDFKPYVEQAHPAEWQSARHRYEYLPSAVRLPSPADTYWTLESRSQTALGYPTVLKFGLGAGEVFDQMFAHRDSNGQDTRLDFWRRNWAFCDHVVSALHVEALIFGLRRRDGDARKLDVVVATRPGYVQLDALFGSDASKTTVLTEQGDGRLFDNSQMKLRDLQTGDHVVFWNSPLYEILAGGDWRLENSIVMEVDSDAESGGTRLNTTRFQGHGIRELAYGKYMQEIGNLMDLDSVLAKAQALSTDASKISFTVKGTPVVRWSPLGETYPNPGAWWIRMPQIMAFRVYPKALTPAADTVGPGYVAPPILAPGEQPEAFAYFPLFEPALEGLNPWATYFARRRSEPGFKVKSLKPIRVGRTLIPGLFLKFDEEQPFDAVRPRVLP